MILIILMSFCYIMLFILFIFFYLVFWKQINFNDTECYFKEHNGEVSRFYGMENAKNPKLTLHREDGPAIIFYHRVKWKIEVLSEHHYHHGELVKVRKYFYDKKHYEVSKSFLSYEDFYYQKNCLHKENGPAYLCVNKDGSIKKEEWFIEGKKIFI